MVNRDSGERKEAYEQLITLALINSGPAMQISDPRGVFADICLLAGIPWPDTSHRVPLDAALRRMTLRNHKNRVERQRVAFGKSYRTVSLRLVCAPAEAIKSRLHERHRELLRLISVPEDTIKRFFNGT